MNESPGPVMDGLGSRGQVRSGVAGAWAMLAIQWPMVLVVVATRDCFLATRNAGSGKFDTDQNLRESRPPPLVARKTRALPQPRDYEPSEEKCCGWLPALGKPPRQAPRNGESKPENVAQQQQQALSSCPELLSELSLFHLFGTRNHQSQFQVKSSPVTQLVSIPQRD